MALTHFGIAHAKPAEKPYKISAGDGLHLLVQTNGSRPGRLKDCLAGKERLLSFGSYPLISLAEAREKRDEAKKLLASGPDPAVKRTLDRIAFEMAARNTLGLVTEEYLADMESKKADGCYARRLFRGAAVRNPPAPS